MRAHVSDIAANERERVLEVRADGDQRPRGRNGQAHRARHIAARPAQQQRRTVDHASHRVVYRCEDLTVVEQEEIGDVAESAKCFRVADGDRFVGQVAARHHERPPNSFEQEMMKRRVGEHHTDAVEPGRHRWCNQRFLIAPQQNHRTFRAAEEAGLLD